MKKLLPMFCPIGKRCKRIFFGHRVSPPPLIHHMPPSSFGDSKNTNICFDEILNVRFFP
ncbi:hypothetical protein I656_03518 [Geobacillus sp. WSUCF1]|nr:hypothetical protein I656_03518 [Geobacillus sp. WSUCF1]